MADNLEITAGTGTTVAADDIGGVLHQRVKSGLGADGSYTDPVGGAGNVSAAVQRMTLAADDPAVVALQLIDDAIKTDDAAFTPATDKVLMIGAQLDNTGPDSVDEGDAGALRMSANRALHVMLKDNAGNERGLNIDASGQLAVTLASAQTLATVTTVSALTGGGVAHDGADSGNPHKIGARAVNAEIAAVANNDRSDLLTDLVGKLLVLPYANPENFVSGAITSAMTGTTSTSLIAAPASGLRNYITTIVVSNAHATVGTDIVIQDGSGGTTLMTIPAAAVYGGAVINLPVPLRQPTTATAIYCANVTTGASTKASAVGYKGA